MNKKHILLLSLFLLVFISGKISSQTRKADSLRKVIKNAPHDTIRSVAIFQLGKALRQLYPDSELILKQKAIQLIKNNLAKKQDKLTTTTFHYILEQMLNSVGFMEWDAGHSQAALTYFEEGLTISKILGEKLMVADSYLNLGQVNIDLGNTSRGLDYSFTGLKYYLELNDLERINTTYNNIGLVYMDQGEDANALNYFQKSLQAAEKADYKEGVIASLNNMATVYDKESSALCSESKEVCRKKNLLKALDCIEKVLKLSDKQDLRVYPLALMNASDINCDLGNTTKALELAKQSVPLLEQSGIKTNLIRGLCLISHLKVDVGQNAEALQYANRAFQLSQETGYPDLLERSAKILYRILKKQNKAKEALEMFDLATKMRDSVTNETTRKGAIKKQLQLEYELQSQRDSLLNEAKRFSIQANHNSQMNQQRNYTYIGLTGVIFLLLITFVSFRAYKNKQKANIIITEQKLFAEKQKQQIEIANKDLERQHLLNQKIFSVISHDFRGPMLSLGFMLDKFKQKSNDTALNAYVQEVNTEVNNANAILNNLLNWARTEINIKSFDNTSASLQVITQEMAAEFKNRLEDKKLILKTVITAESIIELPPDILRISLRNLISNAIKFSHQNSFIQVSYDAVNKAFSVKDNGIGMPVETQKHLFKKEVNTEPGTANEEGFGMGLYIVSELLRKYKFTITVTSAAEQGTEFTISPRLV